VLTTCKQRYIKYPGFTFFTFTSWRSAAAARGRQTREGWGKQAIFELNVSISRKR